MSKKKCPVFMELFYENLTNAHVVSALPLYAGLTATISFILIW